MGKKEIYTKKISDELWCDDTGSLFYYKFKEFGELKEGELDYSKKKWNNDMKLSVAKTTLSKEKKKNKQIVKKEKLTFDDFMEKHVNFQDIADFVEQRYYKKYIQYDLGELPLEWITAEDIKNIFNKQQNNFKLSVYEITSNFLIKVFDFAVKKGLIVENPCKYINFRYAKEKQYVKLIHEKITEIYDVVSIIFHDNPLIVSFFLFLINGKKSKKILSLKWELIDFEYNLYRLEHNTQKTNYLHPAIKEELLKIKKKQGYVYQNDIDIDPNIKIPTIMEESYKINNYIPEFSIKYLQSLVEEFQERQTFESDINLDTDLRNKPAKQIVQKKTIKPKLNIGKFSKKT